MRFQKEKLFEVQKKLQKFSRLWLRSTLWELWGAPLEVRVGSPGFWILPWETPK